MLHDNHGRVINYVRLAVTDRCNLRCFYCMPESGIKYVNRNDLLSFEEMERLMRILSAHGISKLRITGGEPFVRRGMIEFLQQMSGVTGLDQIHITTNGTFTQDYIPQFKDMGLKSVNLSLDTLDKQRFFDITRRDMFDEVMQTFHRLVEAGIDTKINMVVMEGRNTQDIIPMLELAREHEVSVRFIEEMPFNGTLGQGNATFWPARKILEHVKAEYPEVTKLQDPLYSTSQNYQIAGHKGTFGIIAAYTRTFCGSCNRIRITPKGELKTCLYDNGAVSLRDVLRSGATDEELINVVKAAIGDRAKDGFEAEKRRPEVHESMATIGG